MAKLKIGLVFDDSLDKPDGVQQFVLIMGRWLADQGHQVRYLVGQTTRTDLPGLHSLARNVSVRFNQNRMAIPLPANKQRIRELLAAEQFDVLHVQMPYSPALAGRIIKAADDRTVVIGTFHIIPHSALVSIGNRLLGRWSRVTLRRFDAMTATSVPAQAFASQTFRIDSQVVPLPLKVDEFRGAKPFARYAHGKHVVFLGRLVERKGCRYLLRALAHANADGSWPDDTKVVICGGGPLEVELKKYVHDQHLESIVEFTGYISEADKPHYLASADIAIYPSTGGESFGIVLLEAMAACRGLVLAGNNPGYASVLAAHADQLFDPHDTAALARRLVDSLQHDSERKRAHAWQRQYVEQFDVPQVGKQFLKIYNQALHKRSSS